MSTLKVNALQDTSGNAQPFGIKEFDVWFLTNDIIILLLILF